MVTEWLLLFVKRASQSFHLCSSANGKDREVPTEPPVQFHGGVSEQHRLGTMTELEFINNNQDGMTIEQIKENTIKEQERREREGETDQDAYLQSNIIRLNIASVTMKKTGLLIFHGVMERLFLL